MVKNLQKVPGVLMARRGIGSSGGDPKMNGQVVQGRLQRPGRRPERL
jgi:hypothetical protein